MGHMRIFLKNARPRVKVQKVCLKMLQNSRVEKIFLENGAAGKILLEFFPLSFSGVFWS